MTLVFCLMVSLISFSTWSWTLNGRKMEDVEMSSQVKHGLIYIYKYLLSTVWSQHQAGVQSMHSSSIILCFSAKNMIRTPVNPLPHTYSKSPLRTLISVLVGNWKGATKGFVNEKENEYMLMNSELKLPLFLSRTQPRLATQLADPMKSVPRLLR